MKLLGWKVKDVKHNLRRNDLLFILAFFTFLLLSVLLRFVDIFSIGVIGFDEFQYLQVAKWWTEGNFTLDGYYRPAIYFLDSFAIRLFGYHDYSLNLFNSLMDIVNILLVFYITYLISRNKWLGISASGVYAFFPEVILYSIGSFVHTPSATFILLSLLFYLKFDSHALKQSKKSLIYLALSGLSNSIAAHIHPDLAFFAPVYDLLIFFSLKKRKIKDETHLVKLWIIYAAVFSLFFFSLYLWGVLYYGFDRVLEILIRERTDDAENITQVQLFIRILINSIANNTLEIIPVLFFSFFPIAIFYKIKRKKVELSFLAPPFLILGYGVIGSFILTRFYDRLAIPLIPLIIISIIIWFYKGLQLIIKNKKSIVLIIYILSIIITGYNLNPLNEKAVIRPIRSYYKEIYDVMKNKVNRNNKILITPYIIHSACKGFQAPFYFDGNAPYIIDFSYSGFTIDELVRKENIKYIYIAEDRHYDYKIINNNNKSHPIKIPIGLFFGSPKRTPPIDFYGLRKDDWINGYSVKMERKILDEFIKRNQGKLIYESESGLIYELK